MQMRDDHGPRPGPDDGWPRIQRWLSHRPRIEAPGARIDIDEYRDGADGFNGSEVTGKVVTRQDHFIVPLNPHAAERQLHGERARTAGKHVLDLVKLPQGGAQGLGKRSDVAAPHRIRTGGYQNIPHFIIGYRPSRCSVGKHGTAAVDRQRFVRHIFWHGQDLFCLRGPDCFVRIREHHGAWCMKPGLTRRARCHYFLPPILRDSARVAQRATIHSQRAENRHEP